MVGFNHFLVQIMQAKKSDDRICVVCKSYSTTYVFYNVIIFMLPHEGPIHVRYLDLLYP